MKNPCEPVHLPLLPEDLRKLSQSYFEWISSISGVSEGLMELSDSTSNRKESLEAVTKVYVAVDRDNCCGEEVLGVFRERKGAQDFLQTQGPDPHLMLAILEFEVQ